MALLISGFGCPEIDRSGDLWGLSRGLDDLAMVLDTMCLEEPFPEFVMDLKDNI